jgi:hypothetical protein
MLIHKMLLDPPRYPWLAACSPVYISTQSSLERRSEHIHDSSRIYGNAPYETDPKLSRIIPETLIRAPYVSGASRKSHLPRLDSWIFNSPKEARL